MEILILFFMDFNMGHHHTHPVNKKNYSRLILSIWLNVIITVAQLIGGFFTGSLALLSDSLHNFSDVVALVICLIAMWLSFKPYSLKRTFGYKRAEIVAAFLNILVLVIIGVLLIVEAFDRLDEVHVIDSFWVICLALFSFAINAFCGFLLHDSKDHNLNVKAAYLHLVSDAVTSLAVAVGGVLMYYTGAYWLDSFLTLLISFYLLYIACSALKDILRIIMHFVPENLDLKEIEAAILQHSEIKNVHHIHIWQINDTQTHFEAHLGFKEDTSLLEVEKSLERVKKTLCDKFPIAHTVLQPELKQCHDLDLVPED